MSRSVPCALLISVLAAAPLTGQKPEARQIAEAVSPLPDADRAGAAVLGFRSGAMVETLREGTNGWVCLADTPGDQRFQVSCYERGLAAFMARGRELRAEGKGSGEVRRIRRSEMEAGTLTIPDGAEMITLSARVSSDAEVPDSVQVLRVTYKPYATPADAGLPTRPSGRGEAFLMDAGQHRAHIMKPEGARPFRLP